MWAEVYTAGPGLYPVVEGEGVGCLAILQLRVILLLDSSYTTTRAHAFVPGADLLSGFTTHGIITKAWQVATRSTFVLFSCAGSISLCR